MMVRSHNVLPMSDLIMLFKNDVGNPERPIGYMYLNRLGLVIGVCFGIRPTAMLELSIGQFCESTEGKGWLEYGRLKNRKRWDQFYQKNSCSNYNLDPFCVG